MTMPVEYAAIKAAIIQLTRYFARYFKRSGVRCNALSPVGFLTINQSCFCDSTRAIARTKACWIHRT